MQEKDEEQKEEDDDDSAEYDTSFEEYKKVPTLKGGTLSKQQHSA